MTNLTDDQKRLFQRIANCPGPAAYGDGLCGDVAEEVTRLVQDGESCYLFLFVCLTAAHWNGRGSLAADMLTLAHLNLETKEDMCAQVLAPESPVIEIMD